MFLLQEGAKPTLVVADKWDKLNQDAWQKLQEAQKEIGAGCVIGKITESYYTDFEKDPYIGSPIENPNRKEGLSLVASTNEWTICWMADIEQCEGKRIAKEWRKVGDDGGELVAIHYPNAEV
jgi:hypothetical protein